MITEFKIGKMHCSSCANTIKNALEMEKGILKVDINFENTQAKIEFDETKINLEEIRNTVKDLGYEVE